MIKCPFKSLVNEKWPEFLQTHDWTHFLTLTTSYNLTAKSARRAASRFFERIKQVGGELMFWVAEKFNHKPGYHLHVLLKCGTDTGSSIIKGIWQSVTGWRSPGKEHKIEIQVYDPKKGAAFYITKQLDSQLIDYDILINI